MTERAEIDAIIAERRRARDAQEVVDVTRELETLAEREAEAAAAAERRERNFSVVREEAWRCIRRWERIQSLLWSLRNECAAQFNSYLLIGAHMHRGTGERVRGTLNVYDLDNELGYSICAIMSTIPNHRSCLGPAKWHSVSRYPPDRDLKAAALAEFERHIFSIIGRKGKGNGNAGNEEN